MQRDPELIFDIGFDERTEFEIEQKGFFEHVQARLPDGRIAQVCFWDPIRFAQDFQTNLKHGRSAWRKWVSS